MTDDMIALREMLEKGSDATLLREMIGFAAQRLMELETEARVRRRSRRAQREPDQSAQRLSRSRLASRGPARSNCGSRSCAGAATSLAFWSHGGWRRRR